ncbi:Enoyl-CoA hydratase/carnithine racemase, partial [Streptomyces sp. Ncost-T10-10d]
RRGRPEYELRGGPGELVAVRAGAVCRATTDGAVWIPELRPRRGPGGPATFKLPAVTALAGRLPALPEHPVPLYEDGRRHGWSDIGYREVGQAGFLSFSFPGGAMSTTQCRRLHDAYRLACRRPTSVLVLGGGRDFFSNGIHLNVIEAAADPGEESWANINAMDDLVEAVLTTTDRLVVSAVGGNAAAGGVMFALAADEVWCRTGAVLNPHYRLMGLYGSEYWTYTLPRRVGAAAAERLTGKALPVSAEAAVRLGLADRTVDCDAQSFAGEVVRLAARLAASPAVPSRIAAKKAERDRDEADRPPGPLPGGGAGCDAADLLRPSVALSRTSACVRAQGSSVGPAVAPRPGLDRQIRGGPARPGARRHRTGGTPWRTRTGRLVPRTVKVDMSAFVCLFPGRHPHGCNNVEHGGRTCCGHRRRVPDPYPLDQRGAEL